MSQSKGMSFVESWVNVAIGFGINFTANMLVLPLFGFHVTAAQSFGIGIIFTFISVGRSYLIRRWFNGLIKGKQDDPRRHSKGRDKEVVTQDGIYPSRPTRRPPPRAREGLVLYAPSKRDGGSRYT